MTLIDTKNVVNMQMTQSAGQVSPLFNINTFYHPTHIDTVETQSASNLGPLSVRQRNAIWMAFRWRADSGPLLHAYWGYGGSLYNARDHR